MRHIALDLGSSYTKCAVLDENGTSFSRALPTPPNTAKDGLRHEVDADTYFRQAEALLLEAAMGGADGLLLSTQMHGYVLTDKDFRPLSPYVSWQDRASGPYLESIRDVLGPDACLPAGVPVKGNLALCGLVARKRANEPPPKEALLCTLGGYLVGRLCGEHVCHMTNAAPTGLADIRRGGWNTELIERAGLDGLRYPRVETGLTPVGRWRGMPVFPDLGDQQVCALGASPPRDTGLHISLGTAGLIGALTSAWGRGPYENRPWILPGLFLRTVTGLPGGRHAAMLHGFLGRTVQAFLGSPPPDPAVWAWMDSVAPDQAADTGDLWAMIQGGPEAFVASIYAEIGRIYRSAADGMDLSISSIAFSGGAAEKSPALRSAVTSAFGLPATNTVYDIMVGMRALARAIGESA